MGGWCIRNLFTGIDATPPDIFATISYFNLHGAAFGTYSSPLLLINLRKCMRIRRTTHISIAPGLPLIIPILPATNVSNSLVRAFPNVSWPAYSANSCSCNRIYLR